MFNGMLSDDSGLDPYTETYPAYGGPSPIDTTTPNYQGGYDLPGYTPGGGGYGGGGTTITGPGASADSWTTLFSSFPKFAGGLSTIISATQGKPYAQGPYGASGGYGTVPPGASPLGISGGISTTTLLLLGLALVFFMKK